MASIADAPRRIAVSHARVLKLAAPLTLANVTTPLLGLVDATVIGRLGEAHLLGAVALGAAIFNYVFWTFGSIRMATAGLTAQAVGAGDGREVDRTLARALIVALCVGFALILLQMPIERAALALAGASEKVNDSLAVYFAIRIWSAPLTLANYVFLGTTFGRGRTDLGLLLQIVINVANILLALVFVLAFGWGIPGVAAATVIAEAIGFALGFIVIARLGSRPWRIGRAEILDRAALARAVIVNRDIMIRTVALIVAMAIFMSVGARTGDVTLAANAVLLNLFLIGGFFLDGFSTVGEILCGQAVGARDEAGFRKAARLTVLWCAIFGVGLSVLSLVAGGYFIDFVSTNADVREAGRGYLVYAALTPLIGALPFAMDGVFIGATWSRALRDLMLAALAVFLLALLVTRGFGNAGLWTSFLIFLAARGLGQALAYPHLTRKAFRA